jgi:hypothetical protein
VTRPPVARRQRFDRVAICPFRGQRGHPMAMPTRNLWIHAPDQYKTTLAKAGVVFASRNAGSLADGAAEIGATIRHRQHDHLGADADPRIEIRDVFVGEAEAA